MEKIKIIIYKGEKYSDTCISELDFYDEIYGWIFEGKKWVI